MGTKLVALQCGGMFHRSCFIGHARLILSTVREPEASKTSPATFGFTPSLAVRGAQGVSLAASAWPRGLRLLGQVLDICAR